MTEETYVVMTLIAKGIKSRRRFVINIVGGSLKTARQTSKPTATVQTVSKNTRTATATLCSRGREGCAK
jgi:hypothetical protein